MQEKKQYTQQVEESTVCFTRVTRETVKDAKR